MGSLEIICKMFAVVRNIFIEYALFEKEIKKAFKNS